MLHGSFQSLGNAHIVDNQSALLLFAIVSFKHTVHTGYCLHQIVTAHRLVNIHGGERRHVKTREPHVAHDGNLHWVVIFLKLGSQLLLVRLVANNLLPVVGVLVRAAHHHLHLLRPRGAQLQHLAVNLYRDLSGQSHDHCLAGQQLCTVLLIVVYDVSHQRVDGRVLAQQHLQPAVLLLGTLYLLVGGAIVRQTVKLLIQQFHCLFVEVQVHHPALVIYWACSSVVDRLAHVVDVDIRTEHLLRVAVALADGCACEAYERSVGQRLAHLLAEAFLHRLALCVPMFVAIL